MKALLITGGIILLIIGVIPLQRKFQEYEVQKTGKLITVQLTKVPVPLGCKNKYFIEFNYENREYSKQVGCNFAGLHKTGDSIQFKHEDGTDIFLFSTENVMKELIASGILTLFGLSFTAYGIKRKK